MRQQTAIQVLQPTLYRSFSHSPAVATTCPFDGGWGQDGRHVFIFPWHFTVLFANSKPSFTKCFSASLVPHPTPSPAPQIRLANHRHYALYKFIYLLTYLLTYLTHSLRRDLLLRRGCSGAAALAALAAYQSYTQ